MTGWEASALCAQTDPDLWFPEQGDPGHASREAIRICRSCPVIDQCRTAGAREEYGTWGGVSARRRLRSDRAARRAVAA